MFFNDLRTLLLCAFFVLVYGEGDWTDDRRLDNLKRGFRYVFINLQLAKVYIFINKSFTNTKNLSFQIGFVLVIGTELEEVTEFTLIGNIIYTSLTKCKRVICIVFALELYVIVAGIDILITLSNIINIITNKFEIKQLLIIVYIDFFLLYKCIVKLDIIKKKRLMIDIILIC